MDGYYFIYILFYLFEVHQNGKQILIYMAENYHVPPILAEKKTRNIYYIYLYHSVLNTSLVLQWVQIILFIHIQNLAG